MGRSKLPERRSSANIVVLYHDSGKDHKLQVTIGFGADGGAREVFCADFKAGSSTHAIVTDACVLISRLLQHDDTPAELADTLCDPPSLLGAILRAVKNYRHE